MLDSFAFRVGFFSLPLCLLNSFLLTLVSLELSFPPPNRSSHPEYAALSITSWVFLFSSYYSFGPCFYVINVYWSSMIDFESVFLIVFFSSLNFDDCANFLVETASASWIFRFPSVKLLLNSHKLIEEKVPYFLLRGHCSFRDVFHLSINRRVQRVLVSFAIRLYNGPT